MSTPKPKPPLNKDHTTSSVEPVTHQPLSVNAAVLRNLGGKSGKRSKPRSQTRRPVDAAPKARFKKGKKQ